MKRVVATMAVMFLVFGCLTLAAAVVAQEKQDKDKQGKEQPKGQEREKEKEEPKGPLTGVWKCVSHAADRPDGEFQLDLEQRGEKVTGTGSNAQGSAPLKGTFADGKFKLVVETENGKYELGGKLEEDKISGEWSFNPAGVKGTFEGKKT